ncbi:MAG: CopG family transcriptional regulator [Nocardioidaceae bacterium]
MRDLRRLVSGLVIVSFSIAALLGIVALLGGGDFGENEVRVLLTTVIVGVESVAALCYLSLAGHRFAAVGVVGGLASVVATALALWLTWGDMASSDAWKSFWIFATIAGSLAQASLLLALVGRDRVSPALGGTLLAIAVVAVMVVIPIAQESGFDDGYWRTLGVVAILDVLGTVVLAATGVFRRAPQGPAVVPVLSPEVEARLVQLAAARGTSPSQLVGEALDVLLAAR